MNMARYLTTSVETLEMVLLLLWRHVAYYGDTIDIRGDSLQRLTVVEDLDLELVRCQFSCTL